MEKTWDVIKTILICLLVVVLISTLFAFLSGFKDIRDWVSGIVGDSHISVNEFEGAPSNWNGGLSKTEIDKQKNDANCPTHEDMIDTIYIQDYDDIVCFYKVVETVNGDTIYPNIVFVKTENGLKFNGALNVVGHTYYGWFGAGYSYYVEQKISEKPVYISQQYVQNGWGRTNLFLADASSEDYNITEGFNGIFTTIINANRYKETRIKQTLSYILTNDYPHFLKLCNSNVEIIQGQNNDVANGDFNFFYDYLYRSTLQYDFGKDENGNKATSGTCSVDVSKLTVYPLPTDELNKYPVKGTEPQEYYGIYNCNVFITCNYEKHNVNTGYVTPSTIDGVKESPFTDKDIEPKSLSTIGVSLTPKDNYSNDKICEVLKNAPVTVKYFDKNENLVRTIVFNSTDFTNCTAIKTSALENGTYTYKIESNQLIFNAYSGTVNIVNSGNINYEYSYQNGMVMASVNVVPNSSDIDYSNIDFSNYPVKIVFNGIDNNNTYQFVFDSTDKIGVEQTSLMEIGKYQYTILSEKLIFTSSTRTVEITPTNRTFNFPFAVEYETSDLAFTIKLTESASSQNGKIKLSGDNGSVNLLSSKLKQSDYLVKLTVFDENGTVVETFDHTHNGIGGCNDSWTANKLTAGTKYTAQLTYNNSDNSISYTSATFSFTYKQQTSYTLNYSCTEVK